jgi:hypothetical protein
MDIFSFWTKCVLTLELSFLDDPGPPYALVCYGLLLISPYSLARFTLQLYLHHYLQLILVVALLLLLLLLD